LFSGSWVSLLLLVVTGIILVLSVYRTRKTRPNSDYQLFLSMAASFSVMGVVLVAVSLTSGYPLVFSIPFLGAAVTFLVIGLSKRTTSQQKNPFRG
jgi:ABC-type amino acid transport system permease subunit